MRGVMKATANQITNDTISGERQAALEDATSLRARTERRDALRAATTSEACEEDTPIAVSGDATPQSLFESREGGGVAVRPVTRGVLHVVPNTGPLALKLETETDRSASEARERLRDGTPTPVSGKPPTSSESGASFEWFHQHILCGGQLLLQTIDGRELTRKSNGPNALIVFGSAADETLHGYALRAPLAWQQLPQVVETFQTEKALYDYIAHLNIEAHTAFQHLIQLKLLEKPLSTLQM